MTGSALPAMFDADNHYWETSDAFTRHRDPKFKDRGVQVKVIDGATCYVIDGQPIEWLHGPSDVTPRPKPGAFMDYFKGGTSREAFEAEFTEKPSEHPEWFERDARLQVMDEQGLDAAWLFPSQGVVIEPLLHTDIEAAIGSYQAFNRWLEEQWGFAYRDRIFGVPYLTMCDPESTFAELKWCVEHGARVVNIRHGSAVTKEGMRSPADPIFDQFWGLAQEANVVVATHDGSDLTYAGIYDSMDDVWGEAHMGEVAPPDTNHLGQMSSFSGLIKNRIVHDFAYVLVAHRLFERFPTLKVAYIENGCAWVPSLLQALEYLGHGGRYKSNPRDQFLEHCWVAPFVEEDVLELARHMPVDRILFGSDWPHGEGFPAPEDFLENVASFSIEDQKQIMFQNAEEITRAI